MWMHTNLQEGHELQKLNPRSRPRAIKMCYQLITVKHSPVCVQKLLDRRYVVIPILLYYRCIYVTISTKTPGCQKIWWKSSSLRNVFVHSHVFLKIYLNTKRKWYLLFADTGNILRDGRYKHICSTILKTEPFSNSGHKMWPIHFNCIFYMNPNLKGRNISQESTDWVFSLV